MIVLIDVSLSHIFVFLLHHFSLCHPKCQVSCLLTGMYPGKSHGQGPWVSHETHRVEDSSSASRWIRSCSIVLIGDGDYRRAKATAREARVTGCVLLHLEVSPPSLYILG